MFINQFPIKDNYEAISVTNIADYKDLVEVSNTFKCDFYNAGIMTNGNIYTVKVKADYNLIYPLRNIRQTEEVDAKYFLNEAQLEKFTL